MPIEIAADLTEVRPHFQNVAREIRDARISPTGVRAVFEAHGEILTAPAEKGDIRNLTNTPGVMERTPAWSPDGHSIAYFSDESGEYALHIKPQSGEGETRKIALDGNSAFYFEPQVVARQQAHRLRRQSAQPVGRGCRVGQADQGGYRLHLAKGAMDFAWSGDSKWIAYSKSLPNRLHAIFDLFAGEPARRRKSPTA